MHQQPPATGPSRSPEQLATDIALRLGMLGFFLYIALSLIHPFLGILIWSVVLSVALYPIFSWLRRHLGGRGGLAATLVTLLCLIIVFGPMAVLSTSLISSMEHLAIALRHGAFVTPTPPEALSTVPLVGPDLVKAWHWTFSNLTEIFKEYAHTLLVPGEWVLKTIAALAGSILTFAISAVIAGFLFLNGPELNHIARDIARRIAGPHGVNFVGIAGTTIRSVARGIIGVAVLEALVIGVVLLIAGIPHAGFLALGSLILAIMQIGTGPIVFPLIVWMWITHHTPEAILFTVAMAPIGVLDHLVKPLAIGKGLETPLLVIIIGVFGGTLVYGITGLFIGPIVLAVAYDLVVYWRTQGTAPT